MSIVVHPNSSSRIAGSQEAGVQCPHCGLDIRSGEGISACGACGTVQHQSCWEAGSGCGSYACAPARRNLSQHSTALTITSQDLEAAVPLVPSGISAGFSPPRFEPRDRRPLRTSRLAVAAFITAVAGIPLFGLITGLVAIVLGITALASVSGGRNRGTAWAACGIVLGVFDVAGWSIFLILFLGHESPHVRSLEFLADLSALEGADPQVSRGMRANVLIESRPGWAVLAGAITGSGVILQIENQEALIVTNRHVIDAHWDDSGNAGAWGDRRASGLTVTMIGQTPNPAHVVWVAPAGIDLALVKTRCDTHEARVAEWKAGLPLRVGETVFAIGNPHRLGWTHTQGTISQFRTQGEGAGRIRVIQTQTAINAGNSGGGLYSTAGLLVGINTWTNDKRVSEGLSFAIALDSLLALDPPALKPIIEKDAEETQP